jgi:pilus assembly protein CpaB
MKNQSLILLVVAVGCGLVAMLGVKQVISQKPGETAEIVLVLSAIAEIQPGTALNEMNTKFVETALTSVPEGAIIEIKDIENRYLKVPVMPGDWILKNKLTESRGAEASIPEGMGIVTIPVDATTSHSGMLLPGNRIDLLLTYCDVASGESLQKTITVLEYVEVFAVDNRVYGIDKEGDAQAKNITLLVGPDQGKAVTLAGKVGTLSTMMRARGEDSSKGQAEISEEFLTSSFLGSNRDAPSVMDLRAEEGRFNQEILEPVVVETSEPVQPVASVSQLLDEELSRSESNDPGGSGPVAIDAPVASKNSWTMEIYEGEKLRLESVTIAEADTEKSSQNNSGSWNIWKVFKSN